MIEVGNTQVAEYSASGGVKDLTDKVADLGGADWIPGLAEPGKIDGRQYGIPWYAAPFGRDSEIDGEGAFPSAAFEIANGDDFHRSFPPSPIRKYYHTERLKTI